MGVSILIAVAIDQFSDATTEPAARLGSHRTLGGEHVTTLLEELFMRFGIQALTAALVAVSAILGVASCKDNTPAAADAGAKPKIIIGIVAKSQTNQVFQAAHQGARDAARELGAKYGCDIDLRIETPVDEDAQKQAQAVEQLANSGAAGIAVSCSNAGTLQPAIDKAVDKKIPVICFDSDSPKGQAVCVLRHG